MRLRFLKPVNYWPGFLTELAIVVFGVLIALGAQQTVDGWRWQKEVGEFRAAMNDELGFNLGAYEDRRGQSKCINRRLDQLDQWQRQLTSGAPLQLTSAIRRPTTLSLRTSVWESRTSDVTSHLGLKARLAYAELYDEVNGYIELRVYERQVWNEMLDFEGANQLDRADMVRLRGLIERGRLFARLIEGNWPVTIKNATELEIRPRRDPDSPPTDAAICNPLTWPAV